MKDTVLYLSDLHRFAYFISVDHPHGNRHYCRFSLGRSHIWGYYPGKIWSQLICLFLLIPVKIEGREKLHDKTSYIFVPNHQGSFDIFLIYGFIGRNFKWMMKKSLRKLPFVGKACESAGHIFVDRSGPKKVLETIRQAKDSLKDGVSLVVFPEGARTFTGHMGYFKKGAFQLADDLQLAVVPVTIDGSFEILPRTGKWIHRHRMILTIHELFLPKGKEWKISRQPWQKPTLRLKVPCRNNTREW